MKNKGFALLELVTAMLIIGLVTLGVTFFGKIQTTLYSTPSIAKAYVEELKQAITAYSAEQWQECTDFSDVTVQQLQLSGLLNVQTIPFSTELTFNTASDNSSRIYPKSVDIGLLIDDKDLASSVGKAIGGIYHRTDNLNGTYTVSVRQQLTPFAVVGKHANYTRATLPANMQDRYCFDRASQLIN